MKWARVKITFHDKNPHWLSNDKTYQKRYSENEHGTELIIRKKKGPTLDILYRPYYGPSITFYSLKVPLSIGKNNYLEIEIIWDIDKYVVYLNDVKAHTQNDSEFNKSEELGLPYATYKSISKNKKLLFKLRKPPEPAEIFQLTDIPRYVQKKFGLSPENMRAFLIRPSNYTQKLRELIITWHYINPISHLVNEDNHYALMIPYEDRGIDCYIRIIRKAPLQFAAIPIQITEIRLSEQKPNIEEYIFKKIYQAKMKRISGYHPTLVVCVIPEAIESNERIAIDHMKLRDLFSSVEWDYWRIVLVPIIDAPFKVWTLFAQDNEQYFGIIEKEEGKQFFMIGKTQSDIEGHKNKGGRLIV